MKYKGHSYLHTDWISHEDVPSAGKVNNTILYLKGIKNKLNRFLKNFEIRQLEEDP